MPSRGGHWPSGIGLLVRFLYIRPFLVPVPAYSCTVTTPSLPRHHSSVSELAFYFRPRPLCFGFGPPHIFLRWLILSGSPLLTGPLFLKSRTPPSLRLQNSPLFSSLSSGGPPFFTMRPLPASVTIRPHCRLSASVILPMSHFTDSSLPLGSSVLVVLSTLSSSTFGLLPTLQIDLLVFPALVFPLTGLSLSARPPSFSPWPSSCLLYSLLLTFMKNFLFLTSLFSYPRFSSSHSRRSCSGPFPPPGCLQRSQGSVPLPGHH